MLHFTVLSGSKSNLRVINGIKLFANTTNSNIKERMAVPRLEQ
jgi:hypothetical protein